MWPPPHLEPWAEELRGSVNPYNEQFYRTAHCFTLREYLARELAVYAKGRGVLLTKYLDQYVVEESMHRLSAQERDLCGLLVRPLNIDDSSYDCDADE